MNKWLRALGVVLSVGVSGVGCAAHEPSNKPARAANSPAPCHRDQDQRAILAMAGSYDVEFDFAETDVLTAGYQKRPPHKSFATELVIVVDDAPGRVSLQHILQLGEGSNADIIKHWRQDWAFEDTELFEFRGRDVWERRSLPASAVRCGWTQAVFGVDDAPRYDGFGQWSHEAGDSVWTSNETWRPLPRREYTTRSDYDVLVAINRHRITNSGWEHEQDNSKLVLEPRHVLVREHGLNRYTRTKPSDTAAAAAYWRRTAPYWQEVREEWHQLFARSTRITLRSERGGTRLHETLFERAKTAQAGNAADLAFIRETLASYTVTPRSKTESKP